jgi:penicillin-binding protein 1A
MHDEQEIQEEGGGDEPLRPVVPLATRRDNVWTRVFNPAAASVLPMPRKKKLILSALTATGLAGYFAALSVLGWIGWAGRDMPETTALWAPKSTPSIVILDRRGREILALGGAEAQPVNLAEIPDDLINALIAIEDRRFYDHAGFDPIGLARAAQVNHQAGRVVQGGSTITQQLAKNVFLTRNQTLKRKTQEIMLSVWMEHRLSKREILETYLSRVYFGGGTLGIESGAQRFFNKPAKQLQTGEAAMLAGILKAPTRLNPVRNRRQNAERTALVLNEMHDQGFISDRQMNLAMASPISVEPVAVKTHPSVGYFTDWILAQADVLIGAPKSDIVIRTTLDMDAQLAAQTAVVEGMKTDRNAQQAALIAFDGTGGVRAMVGGVDYQHSTYNRAVTSNRQPGSAFKPFVYLAALEAGYSPWEIRTDQAIDVDGWQPGNFSNSYRGPMTLETALALSINTVAVTINEEIGREAVVKTAQKLGLEGLKPYASLALGAQELSLYELASAYVPLANWGKRIEPYGLETIYRADGRVLFARPTLESQSLFNVETLGRINLMLRTVVENGTGRAARISGRDIAGKTGTTNDYRDAWFIGYVPDLVAGVWVGNDDNSQMARVTGGSIPARIWQKFMSETLRDQPVLNLPNVRRPNAVNIDKNLEMLLADIERNLPDNNTP